MKSFENTINKTFTFSSCDICDANCCDGRRGTIFAQIILEDFSEVYENFPIVFILGNLGYLKPVVLLTNGKSYCRYLKENRCSVYEKRPSICRVYPLSPHLTDTVFIDTLCPAVNDSGKSIAKNGKATKEFNHFILENYQEKYINMHFHFDKLNNKKNFEVLTQLGNETFYKFKEDLNDKYLKMHLDSLKNFDEYFN